MRRLLLLFLLPLLIAADSASAAAQAAAPGGRVVVVGVPGLRWSDVDRSTTPALHALAATAAVGVLSVKAAGPRTCVADGWLTLGAGARAEAFGVACGALPRTSELDALRGRNLASREQAELRALVRAVELQGECVAAVGPGAALTGGRRVRVDVFPGARTPALDCAVQLLDAPPVDGDGTARVRSAIAADAVVAAAARDRGPADTLLVVGLAAGPGDGSALHVAFAEGPSFAPGALVSATTRRKPYVQLVDVAPTVLDVLAVDRGLDELPGEVVGAVIGQPWRSVGDQPTPDALADLARKAAAHKSVTVPFFVVLLATQLVLVLLALWRRRPDLGELVALGGVAALGASYLANLVPWWRAPAPLLTLLAVVLVVSSLVVAATTVIFPLSGATRSAAAARREDRRRVDRMLAGPAGVACGFTAAVVLLDLLTGAHLQMSSVAGYSPLVAGRFAGIGNVAFGVLAASVLLATAALTGRAAVVAAVGVVAVAVDGAPPWGSDVGGVLALVPGFVLLAMLLSGRRVTLLRLAAAGAAGAAVVAAFALADWSRRPADRTHLGRFVQDVLDGTAGNLLRRKAEAVLTLLFASPVTALLPLVVAAAAYLVARPPAPLREAFTRAPSWRSGLLAVGLTSAIGFAVNDSGAAVPALALVVALPATFAVVLRARRAQQEHPSLLA